MRFSTVVRAEAFSHTNFTGDSSFHDRQQTAESYLKPRRGRHECRERMCSVRAWYGRGSCEQVEQGRSYCNRIGYVHGRAMIVMCYKVVLFVRSILSASRPECKNAGWRQACEPGLAQPK
jgi:hypothetical protein